MNIQKQAPEVFFKKVFLKISQNSQENTCTKVAEACNFIKKEALAQVLSCEFCETFKNIFFKEQFWATASEHLVSNVICHFRRILKP